MDHSWTARTLLLGLALGGVMPARAAAQSVVSATGGVSHVTGIGDRDQAFQFGGGPEFGGGPVRLGAEIGLVHLPETRTTFANGRGSSTMPAATAAGFSFRASYYPVRFAQRRVQPFVTGGVTVYAAGEDSFGTFDGGGGLDWWSSRHMGLRVEVREQYATFLSVRVGVVLR